MNNTEKLLTFITSEGLLSSSLVMKAAKRCFLDAFGSMLGGSTLLASSIASSFASRVKGEPVATVVANNEKTFLPFAVLANATAASALDFDDCNKLALGHPGAVVVPTALATAEALGATGEALLEAIVVGYEVGLRYGSTLVSSPSSIEVYGSGRWGCIGAAIASARLMGLDQEKLLHSLGIAATYLPTAPLLGMGIETNVLPMTKESMGWGAFTGVFASLMAAEGYTAYPCSLDSMEGLGEEFVITNTFFKPYPSCRWTHAAIDAALALKKEFKQELHPRKIKKVRVSIYRKAMALSHPTPPNVETAQYSIPYTVAAVLVREKLGLKEMSIESLNDPDILTLSKKIELFYEPKFDKDFPQLHSTLLEIETIDDKKYSKKVDIPSGDPSTPLTQQELEKKFQELSIDLVHEKDIPSLLDILNSIEEIDQLQEIFMYLK